MDVTEGVPGKRRTGLVAEHLVQRESLLRVTGCLLILPEQGVTPADRVQGGSFPWLVVAAPVQVQGMLAMTERFRNAALLFRDHGQAHVRVTLTGEIG